MFEIGSQNWTHKDKFFVCMALFRFTGIHVLLRYEICMLYTNFVAAGYLVQVFITIIIYNYHLA